MKRILALLLSLTMLMSLLIVPANAAGEDVVLKITPDKTSINTATAQDVTYTISIEVKDSSVKIGGIQFTLDAPSGMTIPTTLNADNYQINSSELKLAKDEYENVTGGIFETFGYTKETYTFLAAGTTEDRNLNKNVQVMKIKVSVAENTTGSLNFTAKDVEFAKVDAGAVKWTYRIDTTPVTITKAPISDASKITATVGTPMKGVPLATTVNLSGATAYTGTVKWYVGETEAMETTAKANTEYTAKITLTAKDGESFAESLDGKNTNDAYEIRFVNAGELELTHTFVSTGAATLTGILIPELTVAVPTAKPNETQTKSTPIAVSGVYDDPNIDQTVAATLKIVGTEPTGVSLEGNILKVTNKASAGKVRVLATFEGKHDNKEITITKDGSAAAAIVATPPAGGTNITVPTSSTTTSGNCSYKVYDKYGAEMAGSHATWKMEPETVPGVTFVPANGSFSVNNAATTCTVTLYAEGSGVKSNKIIFNITRETSKVTSVRVYAPEYIMDVPKVTEPGTTSQATQQFDAAKVLDQYGQEMTGKTVTWNVADDTGNSVTGVSIDNNGLLTVTNKAPAITVYVTATCSGIVSNKSKVTINKEPEKDTFVEIFNQADEGPETNLSIPAATFTNSEAYTAKVYDQYGKETGGMVFWKLDKTYTGVELDAPTTGPAAGIATLKVDSTATPGTIQLIATCSTHGSTAKKTLDIALVNKTPASVTTAPKAVENLKYTGNDQALVTEGVADGGTMQYSLNGTDWTNTVPMGKNAGDYTVYYKVKGNSTHTDYTPASNTVSVSIAQKEVTVSDITVANKAYDGGTNATVNASGATFDGKVDGDTLTITATGTFANADVDNGKTVNLTLGTLSGASAGNYKLAATGNQTTTTADITQATLTVTPVANQSKKFKEADPALTYNCSGNVSGQIPSFTGALSRAEGEDVGEYDITLGNLALEDNGTFKASNYTLKMVSPAVKFEIKKADAPAAPTGLKGYKDSALSTVTLPEGWSWVDSTTKMDTIGDQTFKADYAGDTNHEAGNNVDVTVKVVRRSSGGYYYAPTAAVVPDMPMLYRGCTGDAVKTLQDKLNALGYNSGSVDGIFGAKTYAAVTAFQKANSLGVDGIVGKLTWGKIYGVSPAMPVETTTVVGRPTVSYGSRGDAVRKLQELLNALGYDCGSVDGIFGSKTKAAVLAFQKANGLGVDGIVGPLTWAKLG